MRVRQSLLAISRRTISLIEGSLLTHEFADLRAAEIPIAFEMKNAGTGVDPNDLIPRARQAQRRVVHWSLRNQWTSVQQSNKEQAAN